MAGSSPSSHKDIYTPVTLPNQSHPPPPPSSRRLPPPCWSHDETIALIDGYKDMWYSLRRGNLKAHHWQEVADSVSARCPLATPSKTAVQCRHKMEKLRKRYRTEIQRAKSMPHTRFSSSWVHFKRMDSMEKGPNPNNPIGDDDNDNDDDNNDVEENFDQIGYQDGTINNNNNFIINNSNSTTANRSGGYVNGGERGGRGFRIRIPNGVSIAKPGTMGFRSAKSYGSLDESHNNTTTSSNTNLGNRVLLRDFSWARKGLLGKRSSGCGGGGVGDGGGNKRMGVGDAMSEIVSAIKVLGDGFVKMEQMKMEMAREIEAMRMDMEMKRVEMVLESQERIVEAFAKAVSEKKKVERMPSA